MRGSVRRRGSGWRAVIDLPRVTGDRRRQASRTFRTRREAERWLAETGASGSGAAAADRGRTGRSSVGGPAARSPATAAGFLAGWLEALGPTLRPGSAAAYAVHVRRWQALLGGLPLDALRTEWVQRSLAVMLAHLAPGTVRRAFGVLRLACRTAVAWGLLPADPTLGVRAPRAEEDEMRCWDEEQAAAFLAAVARTRYAAAFRLALATGMRAGEILGLRWQDIDRRARTVRVTQSLSWPRGGPPRLGEPKSRHSRRTIAVDEGTLALLDAWGRRQQAERVPRQGHGPGRPDPGLVFTTSNGACVRYEFLERRLRAAASHAGLPPLRLHDLRHTHATILLRQGRDVKEVAERLGHASAATTLQIYAHVLPDRRSQAAEVIGRVLDGAGGPVPEAVAAPAPPGPAS